jgi:exodeoxyribonuclease VIII
MKSVMLDFETFGTSPDAVVVQVGACYFDKYTGKLGLAFKRNIDAESAIRSGAIMDASTVYWWLERDPKARNSILAEPREDILQVFSDLNVFLKDAKEIWSHATFDFVILTSTLKRLRLKPLFHYTAAKDIRTLTNLCGRIASKEVRDGVHHDALDDCKYQVKYCVEALKIIRANRDAGP